MTYTVREMFYTLQGEGAQTGRPAVFLRFSGCNLWSGRERDRARAVCNFCDTEFVGTGGPGGGKFASAAALATAVESHWPATAEGQRWVVCTGGEPLLQLDDAAVAALHNAGFAVAVETNGTVPAPAGLDWICVSPKAGAAVIQTSGNELKLVYPQVEAAAQPECFVDLRFSYFFLQPLDGDRAAENTQAAIRYCLAHPRWRLSLQTHKIVGIP
jgi:7-carboxy-7-deazaguanine synthase (Cx14CxxC type)